MEVHKSGTPYLSLLLRTTVLNDIFIHKEQRGKDISQ